MRRDCCDKYVVDMADSDMLFWEKMFHQLFSTKLDSSAPISSKQAVMANIIAERMPPLLYFAYLPIGSNMNQSVRSGSSDFVLVRLRWLHWTMPVFTTLSMLRRRVRVLTR